MANDATQLWHPVARLDDLVDRHVFHGQLLGRELAIWQADDDFVNVWENRCLHRGVRLSIGRNDGSELSCRYHGWRYANRSAGCTYIPAHPADAPARTICNRVFPAVARYGLVWSGEEPIGELPAVAALECDDGFGLRNLPVNASVDLALELLETYRFQPVDALDGDGAEVAVVDRGGFSITLSSRFGDDASTVVIFVQPVDAGRAVLRPVLAGAPAPGNEVAVLRHHASALGRLVEAIEAEAASRPAPEPMAATIEQVPVRLASMPPASRGRSAPLRVQVARKWQAADEVAAFELESTDDPLPTFHPGAHIDVHLPNGLVRQYSITNGPGETAFYRIGVKLEPESRGGSACLHKSVREGDVLAISEPRNNFPLRRDSVRTILVAGGIGLTPLLAMAQALDKMPLRFELHHFVRSAEVQPFRSELDRLGASVVTHAGLSIEATTAELRSIVSDYAPSTHLYVCGPGPMLRATRGLAAEMGWPDDAVHFEYFQNAVEIDDSSTFEIALARSAMTLTVPAGRSILEVLRDNGVAITSSCEMGACGTCVAAVIEGDPDHQDVHLNATERAAGDRIMTCVSRAVGERLVLDL